MCCLAVYSGEGLIADAHDGDARPAGVAVMSALGSTAPVPVNDPVHEQHACHCQHAHGAADILPLGDIEPGAVVPTAPIVRLTRIPASTRLEPQLRPPIVG